MTEPVIRKTLREILDEHLGRLIPTPAGYRIRLSKSVSRQSVWVVEVLDTDDRVVDVYTSAIARTVIDIMRDVGRPSYRPAHTHHDL